MSKFSRLKVFLEASSDMVTTATPPSCLSTVKGMAIEGHSLLNSMKVISRTSLGIYDYGDAIYINGEWVPAGGDGKIEVINPANERVIESVPVGTEEMSIRPFGC